MPLRNLHVCRAVYLLAVMTVLFVSKQASGQVPERISTHKFDVAYWTVIGTASLGVALEAYTTLSLIGPGKRCNPEVESPTLYGRYPTAPRTIAVMGTQLGAAI